jgi:D-glycero-D-manno-heptose 1,7-bisphosphate phosphatase
LSRKRLTMRKLPKKAIFLDKDGTLIPNIPYNVDPERIALNPEVGRSLKSLQDAGFLIVVITNQSGIARDFYSEKNLIPIEKKLKKLLVDFNVNLSGFYYCPHHPLGTIPYNIVCECRKPKPGLLFRAARNLYIDLSSSWMIGDTWSDIGAGFNAGCFTVLLSPYPNTMTPESKFTPDFKAKNFSEAASIILETQEILVNTSKL